MAIVDKIGIQPPGPGNAIVGGPTAIFSESIHVALAPEWFKDVTLTWTYPVEWDVSGQTIFDVYRSAAEDSDYVKLNEFPLTSPSFLDLETRQDSNSGKDYYIVVCTRTTGEVYHSKPSSLVYDDKLNDNPRLKFREIERRNWLLLRKFTGVETLLFKRRTYGERCPECWSEKYQKVMKPKCDNCMGTSFVKGYFDPVKTFFQFEPHHKSKDLFTFGRVDLNLSGAWTVSYPDVNTEDILLRMHDFRLFKVERNDVTTAQTVEVRQIVALTELSHDHPTRALFKREGLIP